MGAAISISAKGHFIGCTEEDKYSGSGRWPSACRMLGLRLKKIIIKEFDLVGDAFKFERALIQSAKIKFPSRCKNIAEGGEGITSKLALEIWERSPPERKERLRLRAIETSRRLDLPAKMLAARTAEVARLSGVKGGSAGKGVSRNAGSANPMRIKAANSKDIREFHIIGTASTISGNWHEIREVFGKISCSRLLAGRASAGLKLVR
jgi:hypothetical protein